LESAAEVTKVYELVVLSGMTTCHFATVELKCENVA
jgi:hypothetical protein